MNHGGRGEWCAHDKGKASRCRKSAGGHRGGCHQSRGTCAYCYQHCPDVMAYVGRLHAAMAKEAV